MLMSRYSFDMDEARTEWARAYKLPRGGNMMFGNDDKARQDFIDIGTSIFETLEQEIVAHCSAVISELEVLDLGCGNGRIALPFYHKHQKPTAAVDPNPHVIEYLQHTIPGANPAVSKALPPLPFADGAFDVVYAISVWTHHPLHLQWPWLREVNRVLKMGGLALITTSSYKPLALRRKNPNIPGWMGVTDDDLRLEGVIYKRDPQPASGNPGADAGWGYVLHEPKYTEREWSRLFDHKGVQREAIAGMQDLHVMVKMQEVSPSDLGELL